MLGGQAAEPERIFIYSWGAAESNAAEWMRHWGFWDAQTGGPGPDHGIDVHAGDAIAQVKFRTSVAGRPDLQRLVGARRQDSSQRMLFFASSGYSRGAIKYADERGIALFAYAEEDGSMTAINAAAELVLWESGYARSSGFRRAAYIVDRYGARALLAFGLVVTVVSWIVLSDDAAKPYSGWGVFVGVCLVVVALASSSA